MKRHAGWAGLPRPTRLASWAAALLAAFGTAAVAEGAWIQAKAAVAQVLLARAWNETLGGRGPSRPWPWADTHPVGRLRAPGHGVELVVLAGATGRSLAFAPGHLSGSALPSTVGHTVIAGHRDTHFSFLRRLVEGETLELEGADGSLRVYRVVATRVVHERDSEVTLPTATPTLTLLTCYPFDTPVPGGPLRYAVRAEALVSLAADL